MIIDYNNISLSSFLISQDNLLFEAMVLIKPRRGVMIIDGLFSAIEPRRGDIDVNCAIHGKANYNQAQVWQSDRAGL
jgi:hypothetical protein